MSHHHRPPLTRREFLARGLIASSTAVLLPNLLTGKAWADCGSISTTEWIPFLVFDMAGGAALPGNFLVGGVEGPEHLLPSYDQLGWNPHGTNAYDSRFGLPMAVASVSGLFNGLTSTASADAQAKLRLGSFCHRAQDDTSTNALSALDLVMRSGYRGGSLLAQGLGTVNSNSGGNSRFGSDDLNLKPFYIDQVTALADAVGTNALHDYPAAVFPVLGGGINALGKMQGTAFGSASQAEQIEKLGECVFGELALKSGGAIGDPRQDEMLKRIYQISASTPALDPNAIAALVTTNVLRGVTGPGVITLGNCDYHTGDSQLGDAQDKIMGQYIGRAVQVAHELKKPLFFQLITDGGVYAETGTRKWKSDAGDKCMSVIGFYDPTGTPKQLRQQVGYYTDGQGISLTSIVGSTPLRGAHAAFVNYLGLMNRRGDYGTITEPARDRQFLDSELDLVTIFEGTSA